MKKEFILKYMVSLVGHTFYPTGHAMIMSKEDLSCLDIDGFDYNIFTPEQLISQLSENIKDNDEPLPSVGTEGATVRGYIQLAQEGYSAILVKVDSPEDVASIIAPLEECIVKYYRMLVIQDLSKPSTSPGKSATDIVKEHIDTKVE